MKNKKGVLCAVLLPGVLLAGIIVAILLYEKRTERISTELEEEIATDQEQQTEIQGELETKQQKLEEISTESQSLNAQIQMYEESEQALDRDTYLKQKMISCYVQNQEILIAAENEVLESMGIEPDYQISYDGQDIVGDGLEKVESAVIDGLVEDLDAGVIGGIAGDTAKETLFALQNDFSMDSLYAGISKGLESGVENAVKSTIQDVVGVDIFSAADLLDKLKGYKDAVPEYLASQISSQMQRDADYLTQYLNQDILKKEDLQQLESYYYDLGVLSQELYEQTDGGIDMRLDNWQEHDASLQSMYERYCINEQIIQLCQQETGEVNEK